MGKIYFISDMHLGATYLADGKESERRLVRFLESIEAEADELIMVGDVLDYWFEYRTVVPRGYVRFFGALARLADRGVKITWFIGNHDIWLFDYLRDEIGIEIVDGVKVMEIHGKKLLISHGDGLGKLTSGFRFIRAMFRNRVCQKLYASLHPRWTVAFAHKWSSHSRKGGGYTPYFGEENDPLVDYCRDYLRTVDATIDYFIFGHRHVVRDIPLGVGDKRMIILGDWIDNFSFAEMSEGEISLHRFEE